MFRNTMFNAKPYPHGSGLIAAMPLGGHRDSRATTGAADFLIRPLIVDGLVLPQGESEPACPWPWP